MPILHCRFVPQAWINDNAVRVDRMEGRQYEWDVEWPADADVPDSGSYSSDALREELSAPQWVRDWDGPFDVYVEVGDA